MRHYPASNLIPGHPNSLQQLKPKGATDWTSIVNDEIAYAMDGDTLRLYKFDTTSTAAESLPDVVIPDGNNTGMGRWIKKEFEGSGGGGGTAPFQIRGALPGSVEGLGFVVVPGINLPGSLSLNPPISPDCNWISQVCASDFITAVYCDPARVANLEYFVTKLGFGFPGGPGAPGWESNPDDAIYVFEGLVNSTELIEVYINDGFAIMFSVCYVVMQNDGQNGGDIGVVDFGCAGAP